MRLDGMLVNAGETKRWDYLATLWSAAREAMLYFFWIWDSKAQVRNLQRRRDHAGQ